MTGPVRLLFLSCCIPLLASCVFLLDYDALQAGGGPEAAAGTEGGGGADEGAGASGAGGADGMPPP